MSYAHTWGTPVASTPPSMTKITFPFGVNIIDACMKQNIDLNPIKYLNMLMLNNLSLSLSLNIKSQENMGVAKVFG